MTFAVVAGLDTLALAAVALCVVGVIGSIVPGVPGALASLAGLGVYWWATGDPGPLVLAVLAATCLIALAADLLAGPLAAKVGGAETRTSLLAGVVGVALLFVLGPVGVVVGIAGTVLALEFNRHGDLERAGRAAVATTVGALGSVLVQLLATLAVLVAVGWFVFV
jgi:hypothetical protein